MRLAVPALLAQTKPADRPKPAPRPKPAEPQSGDPIAAELVMATLRKLLPDNGVVVEEALLTGKRCATIWPIRQQEGFTMAPAEAWDLVCGRGRHGSGGNREAVVCLIGRRLGHVFNPGLVDRCATGCAGDVPGAQQPVLRVMKSLAGVLQAPNPAGVELPGLDFVAIARRLGCGAARVAHSADLEAAMAERTVHGGPFLLEIAVDPSFAIPYGLKPSPWQTAG